MLINDLPTKAGCRGRGSTARWSAVRVSARTALLTQPHSARGCNASGIAAQIRPDGDGRNEQIDTSR
ncbi:hypothetical protein [Xylella fastidiosa]|uniref:hypothetical protein n=1 Tax=Xylella fastidiosa TaxID=2371 RepID=UPI003AFB59E1